MTHAVWVMHHDHDTRFIKLTIFFKIQKPKLSIKDFKRSKKVSFDLDECKSRISFAHPRLVKDFIRNHNPRIRFPTHAKMNYYYTHTPQCDPYPGNMNMCITNPWSDYPPIKITLFVKNFAIPRTTNTTWFNLSILDNKITIIFRLF